MYQNALNQFNSMHAQYADNFTPTPPYRTGLVRSASTSCAVINGIDQPRAPPRRRKRGESLGSQKLDSANSSQYSLVMNLQYNEIDSNMMNPNTNVYKQQSNTWTPNSTLRRYMSSDTSNYRSYNPTNAFNNLSDQYANKVTGVLEQVINRTIPTPPPRLSSAKNTLRRRSYVEGIVHNVDPPLKPTRQRLQTGLNQSQFDIPGTPITTHLPPQSMNRLSIRPSTTLSSVNLTQTNLINQSPNQNMQTNMQQQIAQSQQSPQSQFNTNRSNNVEYQIQPFYNKTMSLDNLHAVALKQNLRRSPTREELFDYIVAQQEQLAELKTQQKVLEKQVDIAHKEASKAHHHHHHRHRHHKSNRSKDRDNLDNSIDSSSMISSERKSRNHRSSKYDKNLTKEANKQVHDHIKQLQEQLELIRQKRRKIRTDKNMEADLEQLDQAMDKSIDKCGRRALKNEKDLKEIKNANDISKANNLLKPPSKHYQGNRMENREDDHLNLNNDNDWHSDLLSPTPIRSPIESRSSSIERAITKRELLKESAKEKWNRSFMEDLADEQLIKELNKSSANQDLLKELLPKIAINTEERNRELLDYNKILEKNLKLNQTPNWLTDPLDEYTYSEQKSPNEPLSPFAGRTGVFRPISADSSAVVSPKENQTDLLTGETTGNFTFPNFNQMKPSIDRNETSSPIPNAYLQQQNNIEGFIAKVENKLITGNIDFMDNRASITNEDELNALKQRQEDKLIEKLENELRSEKMRQKELLEKKHAVEQKQLEHELELEKTKSQLIEQQNLFQEQQQLLQNQRQELEIERWRMEQEKSQLMHEHEMNKKRDQFEQQKLLNQQLEQQRRTFEQQLQAQKLMQEQLQNELEHQKQIQIRNQQQQQQQQQQLQAQLTANQKAMNQASINARSMSPRPMSPSSMNPLLSPPPAISKQSFFENQQSNNYFNDFNEQQQHNLQFASGQHHLGNAANRSNPLLNNKKSPLTSPLQSLQSLLPQALQPKSLQQQLQQQQQQLHQQQQQHQHQQQQLHQQQQQHQQQQLQQQHNQLTNQLNNNQFANEPAKPRRQGHRLGHDDASMNQFSAFKPPLHSNSKLNLIDSPKSSYTALTTPSISTEQQRPSSPRPPQNTNSNLISNPGMLSSTSSLTRLQPVGLMNTFTNQQQALMSNRSKENLNSARPTFYGSNERFDKTNRTDQDRKFYGSGGKLNKTDLNYNNKNQSTGSLHLNQPPISGQPVPINSRSNFRGGNYQLDEYEERQYSSHTNLHTNPHLINGPRRNSVMDPFRDHFDQYFTPKKPASPNSKSNNTPSIVHKISNTDLNRTQGSTTPMDNVPLSSSINLQPKSNLMHKAEMRPLTPIPTTIKMEKMDVSLDALDKLNQNKDNLNDYQGTVNRRLTLPELPRIENTTATNGEQVKGYTIVKGQPKGDLTNATTRRKNSLPENVKSAANTIKPGWNREEVSVLAHEAREAKAKAAEMNATQVTMLKLKEVFFSNLFLISLIVFNLSVLYVYLQLLEPF